MSSLKTYSFNFSQMTTLKV